MFFDLLITLSFLLIAAGIIGFLFSIPEVRHGVQIFSSWSRRQFDNLRLSLAGFKPDGSEVAGVPSDIPLATHRQKLPLLDATQFVSFVGESERQVLGKIALIEMTQRQKGGSWVPRGKESVGIVLAGGIWLVRIPLHELGKETWFKFSLLSDETPALRHFCPGWKRCRLSTAFSRHASVLAGRGHWRLYR